MDPKRQLKLPSVRRYTAAVKAFRARYPWVREFSTWNEANLGSKQPTGRHPRRTAVFYRALKKQCRGCKIVAVELLVTSNWRMYRWIHAFRKRAGARPAHLRAAQLPGRDPPGGQTHAQLPAAGAKRRDLDHRDRRDRAPPELQVRRGPRGQGGAPRLQAGGRAPAREEAVPLQLAVRRQRALGLGPHSARTAPSGRPTSRCWTGWRWTASSRCRRRSTIRWCRRPPSPRSPGRRPSPSGAPRAPCAWRSTRRPPCRTGRPGRGVRRSASSAAPPRTTCTEGRAPFAPAFTSSSKRAPHFEHSNS